MHKINYSVALSVLLLLITVFSLNSSAKKSDYQKEYSESYKVGSNPTLEVDCSFADVKVITGTEGTIKVDITVSVDANSESKAEKTFERINVKLSGSSNKVYVETSLDSGNQNHSDFDIEVVITAPASISLEADVSFGSLEVDEVNGKATINNQYGEFNANKLSASNNDVHVAFGSGSIDSFGGGKAIIEFGEMEIETLTGDAEISNSYGDLEIDHVTPNCQELEINCSFGDTEIDLDENCSFNIVAKSSMGDVSLSGDINVSKESKDWNSETYEGKVGSGKGSLEVNCSFGDVKIDTK